MQLHSRWAHTLLLFALSLPYCINLGTSSIWDANEAFYAETPREMLGSGDYIAPHFNFAPRAQKPPLTYWVILAAYRLLGVNEFAVRLPSAFAAIGVILFSYGIARLLFNPRAGLMAALVTATTARIFILARRLPIDILLIFFLMGTLFFLIWAIQTGKKWRWACAYLFSALGFMTKGPVALFAPAVSCFIWLLRSRQIKLRSTHPLIGAVVFGLVTLPWYAMVFRSHGWTYIAPFFLRDNLGRFASESLGPSRGYFYYFSVAATDFFPWSILALCTVWLLWMNRKSARPLKSLEFGLPILWCATFFLLFSFSKNKQEYYIAPIYPVAGILLSGIMEIAFCRNRSNLSVPGGNVGAVSRNENESGLVLAESWWFRAYVLMALLIFLVSLIAPYVFHSFMPDILLVLHYLPSLVLAAGSVILAWSIFRKKLFQCFMTLGLSLWIVYLLTASVYLPGLEPYRPVKRFCHVIERQRGSGDSAGYFRTALPSMVYYLRQPVFEEYDVGAMTRRLQSGKRVFCILAEKDYNYFADKKDLEIYILDRNARFSIRFGALLNSGYFPEEELLLISNRPESPTESSRDDSRS